MHFAACVVALGSLASAAAAAAAPSFQFPDAVPLEKRQTEGPSYQCHANCGYAIQNSAKDGYCKDEAWLKLLDGCLNCALEQKIWQWYGDKVSAAAKKCGLDATPKPAPGGQSSAGPSSAAPTSAAPTSAAPTSAAVTTNPQASSTAVVQPTTAAGQSSQQSSAASAAPTPTAPGTTLKSATSGVVPTASAPVTSGGRNNATASASPSSVTVSQGSHLGSSLLVAGAAVLFAATWF